MDATIIVGGVMLALGFVLYKLSRSGRRLSQGLGREDDRGTTWFVSLSADPDAHDGRDDTDSFGDGDGGGGGGDGGGE